MRRSVQGAAEPTVRSRLWGCVAVVSPTTFRLPLLDSFLVQQETLKAMLNDGPNPALQKFMQRKAPQQHDAVVKMKKIIPEEESLINYPKDISGTILM